jgi:hypothetical protein
VFGEKNSFVPKGGHGYDPSIESMHAIYIAHGSSFQPGIQLPPFENIHLYHSMCHLLGIQPAPNNGSLSLIH